LPARTLPSGRSLELRIAGGEEAIEVRAPSGAVEVRIAFGADGPVVMVYGGRLELRSPEAIALSCRSLDVRAAESLSLRSDGDARVSAARDLRVQAAGDIRMNGAYTYLNCDEDAKPPTAAALQAIVDAAQAAARGEALPACGCSPPDAPGPGERS
jgi:hypothetical protein